MPNLKNLKGAVKGRLKAIRSSYIKWRYRITRPAFREFLGTLGVARGDVILIHSSLDRFQGYEGTAQDIIADLEDAVGPEGAILMPTLPFTGTAIDYARQGKAFDVRKTPSQMGLLTEIFRRSKGVVRSVHPTHSVAAWGAHAGELIADHHLAATPCGRGTPYTRLLDFCGKTLLLGVGLESMTFFHALEEELEPRMKESPFTEEVFTLESKDGQGASVTTRTRLFNPKLSRRRNLRILVGPLKEAGVWREAKVGRLNAVLLKADDVRRVCAALADRGVFCYDA